MLTKFRRAAIIAALAGATLVAPVQAEAQDRWRGRDRGGDDAAIAIGAGLVGLAIGAAIASDNDRPRYRRHRDYYYDDYYYRPRYRSYHGNDRYYRDQYRSERRWRKQLRRQYRRDYYGDHYRDYDRRWGRGW